MLPDPGLPDNAGDAVLSVLVAPHDAVDDDNDDDEVALISVEIVPDFPTHILALLINISPAFEDDNPPLDSFFSIDNDSLDDLDGVVDATGDGGGNEHPNNPILFLSEHDDPAFANSLAFLVAEEDEDLAEVYAVVVRDNLLVTEVEEKQDDSENSSVFISSFLFLSNKIF